MIASALRNFQRNYGYDAQNGARIFVELKSSRHIIAPNWGLPDRSCPRRLRRSPRPDRGRPAEFSRMDDTAMDDTAMDDTAIAQIHAVCDASRQRRSRAGCGREDASGVARRGRPRRSDRAGGRKETFMAMTMTGEVTLLADRSRVWAMLNDPAVLRSCIPGCQSLDKTGDASFAAVAKVKIGPVGATFKGKVELSDIVAAEGYMIRGEGEGGVAGFAKGGARVALADAEGGTLLKYDVEANVGGKIAQLGSRLIDGVAKKMADQFFTSFAAAVGGAAEP
jgi:carbon monoxide dehydrogenase subunit G